MHWLRRLPNGVQVQAGEAAPRFFDAAVVAVHPDQALLLLDDPSPYERAVLGAIRYCPNRALLHTDESLLPRRRHARASWNYLITSTSDQVLITYDVSRLMRIPGGRRFW
ncbi:amine oxidase domain protein [Mycobacterium xenopi 4042]|uniref:Amine oxidase domain protein n=1 Tax=Mycobacterium xenopi 4042 TaxID=1299334 RepID=X8DLA8_MYCXE|nr:amine oxidase domain protein [Mycobacterium xenopi 4042]